ncbi:MAG: methyltransferase domain-containing protein [Bacteroidota bacterium]
MNRLINAIQNFPSNQISYEALGEFVHSVDYASLDYQGHIPYECDPGDYGRNILTLSPFECVLIYWPPGIESAIHFHEGFYGYVVMLEGQLDNITYQYKEGILGEDKAARYLPISVMDEPDNTIHKLRNPHPTQGAVSLHFYYPALDTLEDLVIYDTTRKAQGVLSATAKAASWSEAEGHFKSVKEKAFNFQDIVTFHRNPSHLIHPIIPKPNPQKIGEMVSAYYCEQAAEYDRLDYERPQRLAYTDTINSLIADHLQTKTDIRSMLHVACGTGRRALDIRQQSKKSYHITGVDISAKMCEVASEKEIELINEDWVEVKLNPTTKFDAATWLYAFGHLSGPEVRLAALRKLYHHMYPGGYLYMDVFNVHNRFEWGPFALQTFNHMRLDRYGYESGDVFYRRANGKEIAYLHYFEWEEIKSLLEEAQFEIQSIQNIGYAKNSGQIVEDPNEGFFFIVAKRK